MDPITILGAVGSVVGIAGFGLQLAQFLDQFVTDAISANESLNDVRVGIYAINDALDQVLEFLEKEKRYVDRGQKAQLFSAKALDKVQSTAEQCLKIFWKIEATILNKDDSRDIDRRLADFHAAIKANKDPPKLNLNSRRLNKRQAFMWSFRTRGKLEGYKVQLQQLQTTLILMFEVISIRINLTRPNPGFENIQISAQHIRYMAAQSNYQDMGLNPPPPYPPPPGPPRPPWMGMDEYAIQFGTRISGGNERRRSIRHPNLQPAPRRPRRRRQSESESPRRGRARHRRSYHESGEPQEERARSSPVGDIPRDHQTEVRRSPSADQATVPEMDTAARLISDRLEAAKKHIASLDPTKKKMDDPTKETDGFLPTQEVGTDPAIPHWKPPNSDIEDGNLSTMPQTGSPLETVIGDVISSPTPAKKASIYRKPFVTDQPSEMSSQETIKPAQTSKPSLNGGKTVDFDPANEYTQPVPIFETFTASPMQIPAPDPEPALPELSSLNGMDEHASRQEQLVVEGPSVAANGLVPSRSSPDITQSGCTDPGLNVSAPVTNSRNRKEEERLTTSNATSISVPLVMEQPPESQDENRSQNQPRSSALPDILFDHGEESGPLQTQPLVTINLNTDLVTRPYASGGKTQPEISNVTSLGSFVSQDELTQGLLITETLQPPNLNPPPIDYTSIIKPLDQDVDCNITKAIEIATTPSPAGDPVALRLLQTGRTEKTTEETVEKAIRNVESGLFPASPPHLPAESTSETEEMPSVNKEGHCQPPTETQIQDDIASLVRLSSNPKATEPAEHTLEVLISAEDLVTDASAQGTNFSPPGLLLASTATEQTIREGAHLSNDVGLPNNISADTEDNQESLQDVEAPIDSQALVISHEHDERISEVPVVVSNPRPQIHITLSDKPAWERPVNFQISPWTDTVFAPVTINGSVASSLGLDGLPFANGTLTETSTTFESESNTTISSNGIRKRELVIESLKRMCRRDFVTEDDLENMFPGVGCFITAFTVKGGCHHQIPYAGQFSLRKTHLYSSSSKWWREFAFLSPEEISSLNQILDGGENYMRSLVLLKWLRKERLRFWSTKRRVLVAVIYNEPVQLVPDGLEAYRQVYMNESTVCSTSLLTQSQEALTHPEIKLVNESTKLEESVSTVSSQAATSNEQGSAKPSTLYAAYTIRVFDPHNLHGDPSTIQPTTTREGFSQSDIAHRIWELNKESPNLIRKKLNLLDVQQSQITELLNDLSSKGQGPDHDWNIMQLEAIDSPSKGHLVVTVYLRNTPSIDAIADFVKQDREATIPTSALTKEETVKPKVEVEDPSLQGLESQTQKKATTASNDIPPETPRPNTVSFEGKSQRERRKSRGSSRYNRDRYYSSEESSAEYSDESNMSDDENSKRRMRRKRYGRKRPNRTRNRSRDEEKQQKVPGNPQPTQPPQFPQQQPPWPSPYPPYYTEGPPVSPYGYPTTMPPYSSMTSPYPSMGPPYSSPYTTPSPYPNPSPYLTAMNGIIPYGDYPPPSYPPYYNSPYYPPTPETGVNRFSMPPAPRPPPPPAPRASAVPTPASGSDSDPKFETREERLQKASKRKATIRQPIPLRPRASSSDAPDPEPTIKVKDKAPNLLAPRPQSYYSAYAAPIPSYGAPTPYGGPMSSSAYAATPQRLSQYGTQPPPSAYSMAPPPSSYPGPYPPRRTPMPYPEHYDGRSYNPLAPLTEDEMNSTNDIVQKLLLDWTPAGEELKEKQDMEDEMEEEEEDEDSEGSGDVSSGSYWGGDMRKGRRDESEDSGGGKYKWKGKEAVVVDESSERDKRNREKQTLTDDRAKDKKRGRRADESSDHNNTRTDKKNKEKAASEQGSGHRLRREKGSKVDEGKCRRASEFVLIDKGKKRVKGESRYDATSSSGYSKPSILRRASHVPGEEYI